MTEPAQPTTEQLDTQAAETLAYERAAEGAVVAALAVEVTVAVGALGAAQTAFLVQLAHGRITEERVNELLTRLAEQELGRIDPDMTPELRREVAKGLTMGARHARELAELDHKRGARIIDQALAVVVDHVDDGARRRLDEAIQLAQVLDLSERQNVVTVMARAHTAVVRSEAAVRWATNRAVNAGAAAVAKQAGYDLLWVAERDACLHCLAYSGLVTEPGRPFPHGLTFAAKPLVNPHPIPYPPLHPNCRCRISPWLPNDGPRLPDALKREARRSVLRGDSDQHTEGTKLRAADQLLARGAHLPKSVEQRAQRAVSRGAFETPAERRRRSGR